eukprot:scaffold26902_cov65-Phaeocystis_antarctica.AAC.5
MEACRVWPQLPHDLGELRLTEQVEAPAREEACRRRAEPSGDELLHAPARDLLELPCHEGRLDRRLCEASHVGSEPPLLLSGLIRHHGPCVERADQRLVHRTSREPAEA